MKRAIWITIVSVELAAVLFLGADVYKKHFGALGAVISVMPIKQKDIAFSKAAGLHYFYEPKSNNVIKSPTPFLKPGGYYIKTVNSDGLNERFEYAVEKPANTYRIIAVGDSFTYGGGVSTKDNYPEQLENLLNNNLHCKNINRFEVINLGVSGYDLRYAAERFKKRGLKYNPDLVLWFIKTDDFTGISDLIHPDLNTMNVHAKEPDGFEKPQERNVYYPALADRVKQITKQYSLEGLGEYSKKALYDFNNHYRGALVLFSFPSLGNLYFLPSWANYFMEITKAFVASRENTYFYDDLINIYENKENYFPDSHPTAKGYSLIANDLMNYLTANRIISCD